MKSKVPVLKIPSISLIKKRKRKKNIKTWNRHTHLKEKLIATTKAYSEAINNLKNVCGSSDRALNKSVYAMNHLKDLIAKRNYGFQDEELNSMIKTAECLIALSNLCCDLIYLHGIDFFLIENTKKTFFDIM